MGGSLSAWCCTSTTSPTQTSSSAGRGPFGCLAILTEGFDTRDLKDAKVLLNEL